jgi:hypothetical protein
MCRVPKFYIPSFLFCLVSASQYPVLPRTLCLGLSLYIPLFMSDPFARQTDLVKGGIFRIFLGYFAVAFGSDFAASIPPIFSSLPVCSLLHWELVSLVSIWNGQKNYTTLLTQVLWFIGQNPLTCALNCSDVFCISPAHPGSVSLFLFLDDFCLGVAIFWK